LACIAWLLIISTFNASISELIKNQEKQKLLASPLKMRLSINFDGVKQLRETIELIAKLLILKEKVILGYFFCKTPITIV